MKKLILGLVAILAVMPILGHAAVKKFDLDLQGTDVTVEEQDDGTFKKTASLYAITSSDTELVKEAIVRLKPNKDKNSEVTNITCTASSPYEVSVTKDGDYTVCKFTASEDTAIKGSKVAVGTVTLTIPTSASNCDIYLGVEKSNAKTGAELNIAIIAIGVVGIGALYYATRSNKKIHNL